MGTMPVQLPWRWQPAGSNPFLLPAVICLFVLPAVGVLSSASSVVVVAATPLEAGSPVSMLPLGWTMAHFAAMDAQLDFVETTLAESMA
jgi:hypothetical protein